MQVSTIHIYNFFRTLEISTVVFRVNHLIQSRDLLILERVLSWKLLLDLLWNIRWRCSSTFLERRDYFTRDYFTVTLLTPKYREISRIDPSTVVFAPFDRLWAWIKSSHLNGVFPLRCVRRVYRTVYATVCRFDRRGEKGSEWKRQNL